MTQLHLKPHLDEVIQCLVEKQKSNTRFRKPPPGNISNLYQSTKTLLSQFQGHINRCKKYNQAKIHRKYQILIKDLSDQNDILKSKVTEQLHARPSSQKYVSDLIDKLIELRRQNERLMRENQSLNNIISTYQSKSGFLINSNRDQHNPQNKELLKKEFEKNVLKDTLSRFLANKKTQNRNKQARQKSNFQKFLMFNKGKVQKWQMIDFFQKIDKWTANLKDMRFIDRSKIKSSFQRSYENEREDSPLSVDRLPNTINTLRMTHQTKAFLENSSISKGKLVERIIGKNKKTPSFRLRTLTHQQQESRIQDENIG